MKEADLQRAIKAHIKTKYGGECTKTHGNMFTEAGAADLICCLPQGRYVALEVKLPKTKNKATPLQLAWLEKYKKVGATAGVVASIEDVDNLLAQ